MYVFVYVHTCNCCTCPPNCRYAWCARCVPHVPHLQVRCTPFASEVCLDTCMRLSYICKYKWSHSCTFARSRKYMQMCVNVCMQMWMHMWCLSDKDAWKRWPSWRMPGRDGAVRRMALLYHTCIYTKHPHMRTHTHAHANTRTHAYLHTLCFDLTCIHIYMYVEFICAHICTYTHVLVYMYTHTYVPNDLLYVRVHMCILLS